MSSPAVSLQNSGLAAQTAATVAVVSIPDAPPEMTELPAGTVLPAVLMPTDAETETPVMVLTLPDGKELSVQIGSQQQSVRVPTPVSIRILPFKVKREMAVRIHFSAPLPDIKKAAKDMPEALRVEKAPAADSRHVLSVKAFVLHSVPEQITALMNELDNPEEQQLLSLKPNQTLKMELLPRETVSPAAPAPRTAPTTSGTSQPQAAFPEESGKNPLPAVKQQDAFTQMAPSRQTETTPATAPQTQPVPASETTVPDASPRTAITQETFQPAAETPVSVFKQPATEEQAPTANHVSMSPQNPPTVQQKSSLTAGTPPLAPLSAEGNVSIPKGKEALPSGDIPAKRPETPPEQTVKTTETKEDVLTRTTLKGLTYDFKERSASLVVTKAGVLALEENIRLPHLTPVNVRITEIAEQPVFSAPEQIAADTFGNLTETLEVLKQSAPDVYEAVRDILPQTGNKLPAQIFSFINATAQNMPLNAFIGEANVTAIQNLGEKGHRLLNLTEKEISSSVKKTTDGRSSWKGWSVPFLSGAVVEPVSLYLQKAPEDGGGRKGFPNRPDAVRFVLDLNLTRLGKLQMDGLAHRAERRFDLIVRHNKALPDAFDDKVRFIFTQTLTALNYTGTVSVDHTDRFITMTEELENTVKRGVWA